MKFSLFLSILCLAMCTVAQGAPKYVFAHVIVSCDHFSFLYSNFPVHSRRLNHIFGSPRRRFSYLRRLRRYSLRFSKMSWLLGYRRRFQPRTSFEQTRCPIESPVFIVDSLELPLGSLSPCHETGQQTSRFTPHIMSRGNQNQFIHQHRHFKRWKMAVAVPLPRCDGCNAPSFHSWWYMQKVWGDNEAISERRSPFSWYLYIKVKTTMRIAGVFGHCHSNVWPRLALCRLHSPRPGCFKRHVLPEPQVYRLLEREHSSAVS